MVPECAVTFSGGAYLEKNAVDRHYPEPRASDSISSLVSGTGSSVLQAGWLLPLSSSQHLRIGGNVRYGGSRFSGPINPVTGTDSADIAAGAFLRYSAFSGRLGGGYSFSWKRDFLNNSLTVHEVDLSHAIVTDRWLCSIDASFQWEYPVGRNYYYFMVYADREMTPVTSMGFSLVTSGVTEEKLDAQNELEFLYSDGARLYTDSTCSTPIRVKAQLPLFMQSKTTAYCMPMSYVGVNPQLHYEWQMNKKIALGINGGYSVSWYPEKYVWHDERYQSGMQPHLGVTVRDKDGFIALNNRDGRYYWVRSVAALDGVTLDSLPVLFHDERRFDQAVSAGISIRTSWGRWGDVIFDATLRRNFSTLMESAPVDIQRWYANAMMTWFFKFKPSENP
jgi:hypothetical protein